MANREHSLAMLERKIAWPLYPILPMKLIPGDGTATFGKINAAEPLVISLDLGGKLRFESNAAIVEAGWKVD